MQQQHRDGIDHLFDYFSLSSCQFWLPGGLEPPSHAVHDGILQAEYAKYAERAEHAAEHAPEHACPNDKSCHLAAVFKWCL